MPKNNELKQKQISAALKGGHSVPLENIGRRLRDVRNALGMTQKQLSRKLGFSQPVLSRIEESVESCTIKTLMRVAHALECELFGSLYSKDTLENRIKKQADIKAKSILTRTFSNMAMEKQAPENKDFEYQLKKLSDDLSKNPGPELWEE